MNRKSLVVILAFAATAALACAKQGASSAAQMGGLTS